MLRDMIIYYPQIAFTFSMMGLVICILCWRSPTPLIKAAMLVCLFSVLPIVTVRCIAVFIVWGCDWLTVGRMWTIPSVAAVRWFESRLQR